MSRTWMLVYENPRPGRAAGVSSLILIRDSMTNTANDLAKKGEEK